VLIERGIEEEEEMNCEAGGSEVLNICNSGCCCLNPMQPANAYRFANSDLLLPAIYGSKPHVLPPCHVKPAIFGDTHAVMACVSINTIRSETVESVQPLLDRNVAITPGFVFRTSLLFAWIYRK
jgi:hypothetical protein